MDEKIRQRLLKIKALAEQGVGGEKETAMKMYKGMLAKYELSEHDIDYCTLKKYWFKFDDELDKKLLSQIFYKVTGDASYYVKTDKRRNIIGIDATDFETDQIIFFYQFYKEKMKKELDIFVGAFFNVNELFPDKNARVKNEDTNRDDDAPLDLDRFQKIMCMSQGMEYSAPNLQLEVQDNDDESDDEDYYMEE